MQSVQSQHDGPSVLGMGRVRARDGGGGGGKEGGVGVRQMHTLGVDALIGL